MRATGTIGVLAVSLLSCSRAEAPQAPDAGRLARMAMPSRPPLPGDPKHGWELFRQHCVACHGSSRRGTGVIGSKLPTPPADLRDPLLLARRSNPEIADVILHGATAGPKASGKGGGPGREKDKDMPAFASELGEQDAMDIVAFLRGDSIYFEECFPEATHFVLAPVKVVGPPMYAAYAAGRPHGTPIVLEKKASLPPGATLLGYVSFAELDLPGVGPTPVAFVTEADGRISGVRVALPEPDNVQAARDVLSVLEKGSDGAPKLRPLFQEIGSLGQWLGQATRAVE